MKREQTLRGALFHLCSQTSKAWWKASMSGLDTDVESAQRLSAVADELARSYEDAIGNFDLVLDLHGKAFGLASEIASEWTWGEINKNTLSVMMLRCSVLYTDLTDTGQWVKR